MEWHAPLYFWMLGLVPVVGGLFWWAWTQRQAVYAYFQTPSDVLRVLRRWHILKAAAVTCAVAALVLALARPRVGGAERDVEQRGLDLIIALDLSRSMHVDDVAPSRIARARNEVRGVLDQLAGDRVALVVFAGTGLIQVPLTTDYTAVRTLLDAVDPNDMPAPGTNLQGAIGAALHALDDEPPADPEAPPRAQALLIVSDGEFHDDHVDAARSQAQRHNLAIFTAGIGTTEGARIPEYDNDRRVGWVRDRAGDIVTTRLNPASLQALPTGPGRYYELGATTGSLDSFVDDLRSLERSLIGVERFEAYHEWFMVPLGVALALLLVDGLVPMRRSSSQSPLHA